MTPFSLERFKAIFSVHGLESQFLIFEKVCNILMAMYEASIKAICFVYFVSPRRTKKLRVSKLTARACPWASVEGKLTHKRLSCEILPSFWAKLVSIFAEDLEASMSSPR